MKWNVLVILGCLMIVLGLVTPLRLVLVLVAGVAVLGVGIWRNTEFRWLPRKLGSMWFVTLYFVVLLVTTGLYYGIAHMQGLDEYADINQSSHVDQFESVDSYIDFYKLITDGMIDHTEEIVRRDLIRIPSSELDIDVVGIDGNWEIFVEESSDISDEIVIAMYQTKSMFQGIDVTEKIPFPQFELTKGVLSTWESEKNRIKCVDFNKEFVNRQFAVEADNNQPYTWQRGQQVIHILVPSGVSVSGDAYSNVRQIGL